MKTLAQKKAEEIVNNLRITIPTGKVKSWDDLERVYGVVVNDAFRNVPFNFYSAIYVWGNYLVKNADDVLMQVEAKAEDTVIPIYALPKTKVTLGDITLTPEQQAVYLSITRDWDKHRAFMNDGQTGSGKTVLAGAIIDWVLRNKKYEETKWIYPMQIVMVVTPKTLIPTWQRHLRRMGILPEFGRQVTITSYSAMRSSFGGMYWKENGEGIKWNPVTLPYLIVFDECHKLNRESKQTNIFIELLLTQNPQIKSLWLSATPWTVPNDIRSFVLATHNTFFGIKATPQTFPMIARTIAKEPSKPSVRAAERVRKVMGRYIYSFPRVKWPHKAYNKTLIIPFTDPVRIKIYETAYERFLERLAKLGRDAPAGRFEKGIALNQFRFTTEPLRVPEMVDLIARDLAAGYAPVMGCAFRNTIVKATYELINRCSLSRDEISIIWGGQDDINPEDVLTPKERMDIATRMANGENISPEEIRKLKKTLKWEEERIFWGEEIKVTGGGMTMDKYQELFQQSAAMTEERKDELRRLRLLGKQTFEQRQEEIDRFQEGKSKVCLFIIQAGGVGLSLDQYKESLRPRVGYFTPIYSGIEFKQALGRLLRRMTVNDVTQYIVGLSGTVEETHVFPILEKKLQCLAKISSSDDSLIEALAKHEVEVNESPATEEDSQLHLEGDGAIEEDEENEE